MVYSYYEHVHKCLCMYRGDLIRKFYYTMTENEYHILVHADVATSNIVLSTGPAKVWLAKDIILGI